MGRFRVLFLILFFVFSGILSRTPVSDFFRMVPEIHFSRPFIPTLTAAEIRTAGSKRSLGAGMFLVATPELLHSAFDQTVILLLDHGTQGAVGVVINKPSPIPFSQVLVDPPEQTKWPEKLYWGGPVSSGTLHLLLKTNETSDGMRKMVEDLYWVHDSERLETILKQGWPDGKARVYAGYSGWAPGQLEDEILRGSWKILEADVESVFNPDSGKIWKELFFLSNSHWGMTRIKQQQHHASIPALPRGMPEG